MKQHVLKVVLLNSCWSTDPHTLWCTSWTCWKRSIIVRSNVLVSIIWSLTSAKTVILGCGIGAVVRTTVSEGVTLFVYSVTSSVQGVTIEQYFYKSHTAWKSNYKMWSELHKFLKPHPDRPGLSSAILPCLSLSMSTIRILLLSAVSMLDIFCSSKLIFMWSYFDGCGCVREWKQICLNYFDGSFIFCTSVKSYDFLN